MGESAHILNRMNGERLASRQIDELIGLAHGLAADGSINQTEVEFLQKWLAANADISDQPVIRTLYDHVNGIMRDGIADADECADLLSTLTALSAGDFELGEVLKPSTLPLCIPEPTLTFAGQTYCFTGTFSYGRRQDCEAAIQERGGEAASLTKKTHVLVIGAYATDSWKHSTFGNKILKAVDMRDSGIPISIVAEKHWARFL
ncbi:BRCT domain-containing protein [Sphingomonas sp.]|uniref:BRCT domain-containing protein n=1 Tax=Sphingomonas sp. TaxID=28214 RepID=UPI003D6C8893